MLVELKSGLSVHTYAHDAEKLVSIGFSGRNTEHGVAQHHAGSILDLAHTRELIQALTDAVMKHDQQEA